MFCNSVSINTVRLNFKTVPIIKHTLAFLNMFHFIEQIWSKEVYLRLWSVYVQPCWNRVLVSITYAWETSGNQEYDPKLKKNRNVSSNRESKLEKKK